MADPQRPLALIDVDGVLNPYDAPTCPPGYDEHELLPGEVVRVNSSHGALLRRLTPHFDLVWATRWEHGANRLIAPLLSLPNLPVIEFPRHPGEVDKLPAIAEAVADRPCGWIDDLHSEWAHSWAAHRSQPTCLVTVDPSVGLTDDHIHRLLRFAQALGET